MERYPHQIGAKTRIRDPLYGFIPLTKSELAVIDTPLFQRLRRIHQLALTKYVYPSAEHSRFVHSIGVLHCATLILDGLFANRLTDPYLAPTDALIKTLRYAALLHDIGHLPFSHAVEDDWLPGSSHEELGIFIIENYEPIRKILETDGVNPRQVSALLDKKPTAALKLYHEIVSGQLDADRADYLLRDSHLCGARYGEYDFHRFLQIFAAQCDDNGTLLLCIDEKDLPVAESLLIARYHYNLQIPYHRTRSGFDFALKSFAKEHTKFDDVFVISNGKISTVDFDKFALLDDGTIMSLIKEKYTAGNDWAKYLLREKHLSPIVDTNSMSEQGTYFFKHAVRHLKSSGKFTEGINYFVQEQKVEMLKQAPPSSSLESSGTSTLGVEAQGEGTPPPPITLISCEGSAIEERKIDIRERSWIFGQLKSNPHQIYRIYSTPEYKQDCLNCLSAM